MSVEFTVLASGSRGNVSLVRSSGSGVMIDLGLGSRDLSRRMTEVGASWTDIAAALLTHTHGDHVCDATLRTLATRRIPFYCHEGHRTKLVKLAGFQALEDSGQVRVFDERPFLTPNGMRVEPITLSHDSGPTFGFRIESRPHRRARAISVGYVADTGSWRSYTADCLMELDVLAVEFNHDVDMQKASGRAPFLIARNLGPRGHLSNEQGAGLVSTILAGSSSRSLRHVVLLHLSEQCNRPDLARDVARAAVKPFGRSVKVHVAGQYAPFPQLPIAASRPRSKPKQAVSWRAADLPSENEPYQLVCDRG